MHWEVSFKLIVWNYDLNNISHLTEGLLVLDTVFYLKRIHEYCVDDASWKYIYNTQLR